MTGGGSLDGIEESVSEGISEMCGDGDEDVVIIVYVRMCLQGGKRNRRERQMSGLPESTILNSVATFTVVQSLLAVLVCLLHTQLVQIPDVSGQSSMVFVLQEWTSSHPSFFGKFET